MARITRAYLNARLARLNAALGRTDLEFEIWSPGTRYQIKSNGGSRDFSPVGNARTMDYFLDGALACAERCADIWSLQPGRTLARDGAPVARMVRESESAIAPSELDDLARAVVRALNRSEP